MGNESGEEVGAAPVEALRGILSSTGWSADALSAVRFTGCADPVLPTLFGSELPEARQ
jgi:hypothetical protein